VLRVRCKGLFVFVLALVVVLLMPRIRVAQFSATAESAHIAVKAVLASHPAPSPFVDSDVAIFPATRVAFPFAIARVSFLPERQLQAYGAISPEHVRPPPAR
jgi:hypothetical protein